MKNNNNFKFVITFFLIFFIFIFICILLINNKKDTIYYRVYSNGKWSQWYENGKIAGDLKNNITEIEIRTNDANNDEIYYKIATDENWSKEYLNTTKEKNKKRSYISGIKMDLMGILRKKYDIFYRTYNKKNGWLGWSWNYIVNGNSKEAISGIEIQLVEKDSDIEQILEDYDSYKKKSLNY